MIIEASPSIDRLLERLKQLMDQQIWRWGCDIKHPSGNLLVKYGFERLPPPVEQEGCSSVYLQELGSGDRRWLLRGFGLFYGDDALGGMVLKRFDATPYQTPAAELHCMPYMDTDLPFLMRADMANAHTLSLLAGILKQIIKYESWVCDKYGLSYIEESLSERSKRPVVSADKEIAAWRALATQLSEILAQ